jgi:type IV pilus assembly protein PilO
MDIRDPRVQKGILVAALVLGLGYGFFFTDVLPFTYRARAAQTAAAEAERAQLSADVAKARAAVANLPALERECAEVHARWRRMAELLPSSKEVASLLTKVTLAGQESGIRFALFQPGAPRPGDYFVSYPTQVRVEGGYHAVGRFMAEVANLDRIVNFADLNLSSAGDAEHPEHTVVGTFTAEAYAFRDSAGAAMPAGTVPGGAPAAAGRGEGRSKQGVKP